ncbi:hypothetical protein DFH09DRAFT_78135 [Mycena vulgaris]|nr:hypothetical protein DFH09DRAFT_78135 [Mycena vulgaris]
MGISRFRIPLKLAGRLPMIQSAVRATLAVPRATLTRAQSPRLYKLPIHPTRPHPMPATIVRRSSDALAAHSNDVSVKDSMDYINFDDSRFDDNQYLQSPDEQMLFDFDDYNPASYMQGPVTPGLDPTGDILDDVKPVFPHSPPYELSSMSPPYSPDSFYGSFPEDFKSPHRLDTMYLHNWLSHETDTSPIPSPSSPIPIPSPSNQSPSFVAFGDRSAFAQDAPFSPAAFAAALPLPGSSLPIIFLRGLSLRRGSAAPDRVSISS